MTASPKNVMAAVNDLLWPAYIQQRQHLWEIDRWYRWEHPDVHAPRHAKPEHRKLIELSKTPWLGLVVSVVSQSMFADGYRSKDTNADAGIWKTWQANKFDMRQVAIHRAALAYGYSFVTVLPGKAADGSNMAAMRGVSPLNMTAVYGDLAEDDWPIWGMRVFRDQPGGGFAVRVYDETDVHYLSSGPGGTDLKYIQPRAHGAGVCPVVRYSNQLDLNGRSVGEVEPFIPIAARINKTDYDRLVTQHFASWKIRYATGMERPETDDAAAQAAFQLSQKDFLIAESPDAKFGTLDASSLADFIAAKQDDVETLAAVTQTPTHSLTGQMINLSADALAAARAQLELKVGERKVSFGESHAQSLRLAAQLQGDPAAATDVLSRITWQDTSVRSLSAAVDALGKAATMLSVPVQALWPLIPGVSKEDVDEWKALALTADPIQALHDLLAQQSTEPPAAEAPAVAPAA